MKEQKRSLENFWIKSYREDQNQIYFSIFKFYKNTYIFYTSNPGFFPGFLFFTFKNNGFFVICVEILSDNRLILHSVTDNFKKHKKFSEWARQKKLSSVRSILKIKIHYIMQKTKKLLS